VKQRHAYAMDGLCQSVPLAESVLLRQDATALGMALRNRQLAAQGMQNRSVVAGVGLRMRMTDSVGTLHGGIHACDCRINVTKQPENPRHQREIGYTGILAGRTGGQSLVF